MLCEKTKNEADVDTATEEEVQGFMNDTDEKTVLVDSRAQESYAGWALEGAKKWWTFEKFSFVLRTLAGL